MESTTNRSPSLENMLFKNKTDGIIKTHVTMGTYPGSYMFDGKGIESLFEIYSDTIESGKPACLAEMIHASKCLPVLVDIDIKTDNVENCENETIYTHDHIIQTVQIYQSVLRYIIHDCEDIHLTCVVLEKPRYSSEINNKITYKNGIHMHFPYTFMSKQNQEIHLIPRVLDEIERLHVFDDITTKGVTVKIDNGYCNSPWLMYGSSKDIGKQPYTVSKIYDAHTDEISLENAFKHYRLYDNNETVINITRPIKYYLPRFLSIIPFPASKRKELLIKPTIQTPVKEKAKIIEKATKKSTHKKNVDEDMRIARRVIPMLSDHRTEDRNDWINIGWILFNISEGTDDGLKLWCDFSSRSETNYSEASCIHEWASMVMKERTIGSLLYLAKLDSPEEYKKFKTECIEKRIDESISLTGSHYDIAKILHEEFKDEFVCSNPDTPLGEWYQFREHRWVSIKQGVYLSVKLSEEIFMRFKKRLEIEKANSASEIEKESPRQKQILKIMRSLKENGFKNSVMKECKALFYNEEFKQRLDMNKYLFGFRNGVYDLSLNAFRPGMPDDYLSKSATVNYTIFTEDSDEVKNVHKFLEQIFPDKDLRKYFLDIYSDIFLGGNHQKLILFWTGVGNNGKSVTQGIFEKILGKYAIKFDTSVVTGKKPSAGAANADLARAGGGIRWVSIEEPDIKEHLNVGTLKHLSGNDTCYARDLFEKGKDTVEFMPLFKMAIICNDLPPISYSDQAIWNRLQVFEFESEFCDADKENFAPDTYEEQLAQKRFPMIKNFEDEIIPKLLEPFTWVLLNHRKSNTCRRVPARVRKATELFRKSNDTYKQFMDECVIKLEDDVTTKCSLHDMYTRFKQWYKESYPHYPIPIKEEAKKHITIHLKIPFIEYGAHWVGVKIRLPDSDNKTSNSFLPDL